jgi:hypothetical protein
MYSIGDAVQETQTKQRPITKVTTCTFFAIYKKNYFSETDITRPDFIFKSKCSYNTQNAVTKISMLPE